MDDLIAFLRAQLDEVENGGEPDQHTAACGYGQGELLTVCDCGVPARVLADVASKRQIIDDVVPEIDAMDDRIELEWGLGSEGPHDESRRLLKLLALPFSGHPDYRKEWTP